MCWSRASWMGGRFSNDLLFLKNNPFRASFTGNNVLTNCINVVATKLLVSAKTHPDVTTWILFVQVTKMSNKKVNNICVNNAKYHCVTPFKWTSMRVSASSWSHCGINCSVPLQSTLLSVAMNRVLCWGIIVAFTISNPYSSSLFVAPLRNHSTDVVVWFVQKL